MSTALPIVLAYSGGLDTSFLVPWLKDNYGRPVITVTVDTGGIDAAARRRWRNVRRPTAPSRITRSTRAPSISSRCLRFLVMGNVRRGQLYPLCVGAERVMQAQQIALMARKLGTNSIAHGCTAAGNDQVRFEVAMRTLAPELEVIAPVRDKAFKRQEELDYLNARGLPLPPYGAAYSINRGLWGVTIGGKEDADLRGQHPGLGLGAVEGRVHESARAGEAHDRVREGPAGRHRRPGDVGRRRGRKARDPRRARMASAAASISAIPSSAPRAAWHSKRRPPRPCSPRTASSRSWC
jgi:argininosuccinate synthase